MYVVMWSRATAGRNSDSSSRASRILARSVAKYLGPAPPPGEPIPSNNSPSFTLFFLFFHQYGPPCPDRVRGRNAPKPSSFMTRMPAGAGRTGGAKRGPVSPGLSTKTVSRSVATQWLWPSLACRTSRSGSIACSSSFLSLHARLSSLFFFNLSSFVQDE